MNDEDVENPDIERQPTNRVSPFPNNNSQHKNSGYEPL